jgi:hypothetical protein
MLQTLCPDTLRTDLLTNWRITMSKSTQEQSSTNNQSQERLVQKTPLQPKPDNFMGQKQGQKQFLFSGTRYTLAQLVNIFSLTNAQG